MRFLEGPAGTGKTTYAVNLLHDWLQSGIEPHRILVLVPQRTLGRPYQNLIRQLDMPNVFDVQVVTFNGLAQRALSLFWGLVAEKRIPNWQGQEPTYLTIETAQYYMAQFAEPVYQEGYFDSVSLNRSRLIAQILNNLSAAAVNNFTLDDTLERLKASWGGHSSRFMVYDAAIRVAQAFRKHCLENALLDFSLQVELFTQVLTNEAEYIDYAQDMYQYVIVDNVEENFPVTLDFIGWIWNSIKDGAVLYDTDAGFRLFLGATPDLAYTLKDWCKEREKVTEPIQQAPHMVNLEDTLTRYFNRDTFIEYEANPLDGVEVEFKTFYPEMLDWTAERVIRLVNEGVSPRQIAVLAPFLGDSLRFTLINQFEKAGIPFLSHRPSRAIRDEPVARAVLACMKLAYGEWADLPSKPEVSQMLIQFIDGLDPIRAELLSQIVYHKQPELGSFDTINANMQKRITFTVGERFEYLRNWLYAFQQEAENIPPDHFIRRLFDLVSQPGYGFHVNLDAGRVVSQLIDSAYQFRDVVGDTTWGSLSAQYIRLVGEGVLAAVHYNSVQEEEQDAVFIAPAYTFLMRNRFVDYQFWVDAGSNSWFERLEQPITHPYVLRRDYPVAQIWTDEMEVHAQTEMLKRLMLGLTRRCRQKIHLGITDLGEQGFEQRGILLRIFNRILSTYGQVS